VSTLNDFDINELVLQLHGELKFAFEVANAAEKEAGMQLQTVKARLGRKDLLPEGDIGEDDSNGLNPDRYPDKEDWELEVAYKYGDPIKGIPKSQNWVSTSDSRLVLERLGDVEVVNIKGVSKVWVQRLATAKILTIENLVLAPHEQLLELCEQYNSFVPLEFQTKVLLLVRDFTPLPYTEFYGHKLFMLLENNLFSLKRLFKGKLSGPEISDLRVMASIIQLVFDRRFAEKLRLGLFAK